MMINIKAEKIQQAEKDNNNNTTKIYDLKMMKRQ